MADKELILDVKTNIDDAAKDAKKLGDNLEDAGDKGKKGFKGIGTAIKGIGTALKAAGIGIVVALLAKLMEVFRQNQKVLDTFDIAMESLSIAFNDLFSFISDNIGNITSWFKDLFENPQQSIKDFGTAIKENLIERFNSALDTLGHLAKAVGHLFKGEFAEAKEEAINAGKEMVDVWTGVDDSVDKVKDTIVNYTKEVVKSAKATVELNKASELAKVQGEKMQELVDIQVKAAQVEYDKNQSQENLITLTEALNEKKAVEAQITGFQSEQLTNQVALEKELLEAKNELLAAGLEGIELELAELENAMARKAGEDDAAITEQYEKQKAEITQTYLDIRKEAQLNFVSIMGNVAGKLSGLAKEGSDEAKALALIEIAVGTGVGFIQALDIAQKSAKATGPGAAYAFPIFYASQVLSILGAVASAKQALGQAGASGGVSAPSVAAPRTEVASGAFTLGGGIEPEPARAFVVSDDITRATI